MSTPSVVAVVVSYNRAALLGAALDALAAQSRPLERTVVVDNASTDDALEVARAHPSAPDVVALKRNTGGAGGFAVGLATAVADLDADLVWLMDDDTVPTETALEALLGARDAYPGDVTAMASRVVWTDGSDHPMNTPRSRPGASPAELSRARAAGAMPVRSMSFVSMLVDARAVREHGLPVSDFFIWNDDFEYSTRLLRRGTGLYVPGSVVEHRTARLVGTDHDPGPRFYYEVRNKVWTFTRSSALAPSERLLYGGSTLRRWARTVARSSDRGTLLKSGGRGLWHGLVRRPRADTEVLAGVGPAALSVARVELGQDADHAVAERPAARRSAAAPAAAPVVSGPLDDHRFSVLLPVYAGDDAAHLERGFLSVTRDQTLRPDEVVVVRDGPVGDEIAAVLGRLHELTAVPVTLVPLERNVGLARALEAGLEACKHEIVARADADDISRPERFAVQVPLVAGGCDIVGSAIQEFDDDEHAPGMVRVPPTGDAIATTARFRDPFNHPSVVYRRSAVAAAGGYEHLDLMEDYLLFARMIAGGADAHNVVDPLVLYRVGAGAYARRGGRRLLASELALQRTLHSEGFLTGPQMVRNVVVRAGYRVVPESVRKAGYRAYTRLRGGYEPD
ncbi:glycosyltransferase [Krasilnikoviella flava]|uniref:Glycosyltransferase, GT2 family n=1 Tax=Krasilnikoviella flava TaxID=526729 RepID=A0A1T5IA29_9MICO|nr:glycosyltransferase [Krasilnikoviella flava]SKC36037.1 Glycosyltransferase, GT2 family [Krasilnikoviella flava]